ncbi:MAG TPA: phosphatidylserine decarboxylase [Microlunatus sp.]
MRAPGPTWREAARYVVPSGALALVLLLARRREGWLALALACLFGLFFRDPERPLDPEPGVIYAAADGLITGVDESAEDKWMPDGRCLRIVTFLNLHNVHVNRVPVAGTVAQLEAVPGGFAPALLPGAGENSRRRIAIDGDAGRVVVIQVAGSLARKISVWVKTGERLDAAQRFGMIHLGSRTDVLLPVGSAEVLVSVGQRVRAGVTPLARYRSVL